MNPFEAYNLFSLNPEYRVRDAKQMAFIVQYILWQHNVEAKIIELVYNHLQDDPYASYYD